MIELQTSEDIIEAEDMGKKHQEENLTAATILSDRNRPSL